MSSNQGKLAEAKVRKHLESLAKSVDVVFMRLPDAHGGSRVATMADYLMIYKGKPHLVEVKSVRHAYRLPHGNFDGGQVARMKMWGLAGVGGWVIIYHELEDNWRVYPVDRFSVREGGSWDLRDTQPGQLSELFSKDKLC